MHFLWHMQSVYFLYVCITYKLYFSIFKKKMCIFYNYFISYCCLDHFLQRLYIFVIEIKKEKNLYSRTTTIK